MRSGYFDIGGTNIRYEIYEDEKKLGYFETSTKEKNLLDFLSDIISKESLQTVGISFAGQVNSGTIESSPNISIESINISKWAKEQFDCDLYIDNDLNCIALAEYADLKVDNLLVIYPGTGLGGAYIVNGIPLKGEGNKAVEIGHIPYKKSDCVFCGCGRDNCIEIYASGSGMKKQLEAKNIALSPNLKNFRESEEKQLQEIYENFVDSLAFAIGSAITLLNPAKVVLGGGVYMPNRDFLEEAIRKRVAQYAFAPSFKEEMIVSSKAEYSGIEGAKILVASMKRA